MMQRAQAVGDVPGATMNFTGIKKGALSPLRGMKKGGKVHEDVAADKALIKKMVKPSARTARKEGGGVFTGPGYPGKVPGVVPGGRMPRATGGKAGKGKTNINIIIGAGKPAGSADMAPNPMGGPTPPPGVPVSVPPPAGAPPMPMPMPMPMPSPAAPPGMPPMPRKSGGRAYRSYKDMDAGSGSGEGRLEKAEIASRHPKVLPGNY
jgi:hypothetical protein